MAYLLIFFSAIFVNNIVFSQFLGICPFLGVSKKVDTALGMSAAVAFVLTIATIVTYLIQILLIKYHLEYLQTIAFILVIAALVQMVEIVLKKVSPALYQALGVFLPLITTNCCILGVAILVAQGTYNSQGLEPNLLSGVVYAVSTALGFGLALTIFAAIREQLAMMDGTNLPVALGVIRDVDAPSYETDVTVQMRKIQAKHRYRNLRDMILDGDTWERK